jgi:3-dehydro-L-gulonate 2-dehydrogenase
MDRAIAIAKQHGIGCVAVKNTNQWMRGGTYGWQAAESGCIAFCGTNAIANMPPWGGKTPTLANNPFVIAVPRKAGHLVLDMAMSQFSYGKMQEYRLRGSSLPVYGGYDENGELSRDPSAIVASRRTLPAGFWKGSGLSLMMDVLVATLSDGQTVKRITAQGGEFGVSQFFLCLAPENIDEQIINEIIDYAKSSQLVDERTSIRYPGEQPLLQRRKSEMEGIEVNEEIWEKVRKM